MVVVAVSLPLLQPEFIWIHDYVHAARIGELLRGWQAGHWPVRWSEYFGFGYGMPLFSFYAPLPYYLGAVWHWLGVDIVTSVKLVFLLCSGLTAYAAYWSGRRLGGQAAGLLTAALYTLAPYRAVNLYVRGALSEAWAMAFFPVITLGSILVVQQHSRGWLVLTAGVTGLLLTHNLSSLIFLPLSLGFGVVLAVLAGRGRVLSVWRSLLGSYALSGGLAAFYVLPAFIEKNTTQIETILQGYFDFRLHFVYLRQLVTPYWGYGGSAWGVDDGLSFFIGWGLIGGLVVVGVSLLLWLLRRRQVSSPEFRVVPAAVILSMSLGVVALAMSLGRLQPLWERVELLSYVQFPWRWLAPAAWWLALGIGLSVALFKQRLRWVVVAVVTAVAVVTQVGYFQPERHLDEAKSLYYTDPERIARDMSKILMDYIPVGFDYKWAQDDPLLPGELVVEPQLTPEQAQLLVDRPHQRLVRFMLPEPTQVTIGIANFPGWRAELDGQEIEVATTERGLIEVSVPAGEHTLGMRLTRTPVQVLGDSISLVTAVGLVAYGFWSTQKKAPPAVRLASTSSSKRKHGSSRRPRH